MPKAESHVRVFTRDSIRRLDRLAVERYGVPSIVLMENAGIGVAHRAMAMLRGTPAPRVAIFCGPGNNGGDGLVAARHLHNAGVSVEVVLAAPRARYSGDAGTNLNTILAMRVPIVTRAANPDLVIDAVFGTGLDRPVRGRAKREISRINDLRDKRVRVLAVDLPSGLECDTGVPLGVAVHADVTVTLVGWKRGFQNPAAKPYLGRVAVADIGVPRGLVEELGSECPAARGRQHNSMSGDHRRKPAKSRGRAGR